MKILEYIVYLMESLFVYIKRTTRGANKILVGLILSMVAMQVSATTIASDQFSNGSKDGWSGSGINSYSGYLVIDRDRTASKTYYFPANYANKKVTVRIRFNGYKNWESSDKFKVNAAGTNKSYTGDNNWHTITFDATLDGNGNLPFTMKPDTSWYEERAYINYVTIDIDDADLKIFEKSAPTPNPVDIGDDVTFEMTTRNYGPNTAKKNLYVKVKYNQDVEVISSHYDSGNDFNNCDINSGTLTAGSYITCFKGSNWSNLNAIKNFTFVVKPSEIGTLTQTATIESTGTVDTNTPNNSIDSSVEVEGHICGGCDCSLDNNNHTSPGVVIPTLDGATDSVSKCISGESMNGDNADYYKFTVATDGTLDISTSSPNSHPYHLKIGSSANGNQYYGDSVAQNHSVNQISLSAGDTVYIYVKETGSDLDAYQLSFTFTKVSSCNGCDCQYDINNHTSPGMLISGMNNVATDKSICMSGSSTDGDAADYYHFRVDANGTLAINTLSPNGHDYHLKIGSTAGGDQYYKDVSVAQDHNVPQISLVQGDEIFIYIKETGSDTDEYQLNLDFSVQQTVENADDICYGEITETSIFGMIFPKTTVPINNISGEDLTDTKVFIDTTSLMKLFSGCSVDGGTSGDNCDNKTNYGFGPVSVFSTGTEYTLGDSLTASDANHTVEQTAMFDIGELLGGSDSVIYAEYTKNGTKYVGKMKACNPSTDTIYDGLSPFVLINPEYTRNIQGDYQIAGNTVTCLTEKTSGYGGTCHGQNDYESITSNMHVNKFIDIDNTSSTWNSTSSNIELPPTYDQRGGKGILWAGLFWQGRAVKESSYHMHYGRDNLDGTYTLIETGKNSSFQGNIDIKKLDVNYIKLKIDDGNYSREMAKTVHTYYSSNGATYAAYSDVTTTLQNANLGKGKHTFTVANLVTEEGRESSPGLFGGWSLVVIFAEDFNGKPRNISTYYGFDSIGKNNDPITISGFKLPSAGKVKSALSIFSGEGEYRYHDDWVKMSDDKNSGWQYMPGASNKDNVFDAVIDGISRDNLLDANGNSLSNNLQANNNGVDIDNFDVSDLVKGFRDSNTDISELYIKWWSGGDYITPSMLTFSTELYVPELCYDYTMDIDGYVLDSTNNKINTPFGGFGVPLTTHFFVQSLEGDISFVDINISYALPDTTQVSYISGSTEIAENDQKSYINASPWTHGESAAGFSMFAGNGKTTTKGGTFAPQESRYIKLSSKFNKSNIDTEFIFAINYKVDYGSGVVPMHQVFTYKNLCKSTGGYDITYGQFNVVDGDASLSNLKYNLYTQVARRPFDLKVVAHDPSNPLKLIDHDLNTSVEVEFIRADHFIRDIDVTCHDEHATLDSNLSQAALDAKFVHINGKSANISYEADDLEFAYRSMAMRVWYLTLSDGSLINDHDCQRDNEKGCVDLYSKHFSTTGECNMECFGTGAGCYDCIRKNHGEQVCSRDNFSVRPEAFLTKLMDSDQNNSTAIATTRTIATSKGVSAGQNNLAAGYRYRFDINATSYDRDIAVKGYIQDFKDAGTNYSAEMTWAPASGRNVSNCGDTAEKNITVNMFNGSTVNVNTKLSNVDRVDQIGEYKFRVYDSNWTSSDWYSAELSHHLTYSDYFESGSDCIKGSDSTNKDSTGCLISSKHTGPVSGIFDDLQIRFYPYKFNATGLASGSGPDMNGSFVYINTLDKLLYPNNIDENMSYNIRGEIYAAGYDGDKLSNFVDKCYADDIDMKLKYTYLSTKPDDDKTPKLSYSIYNEINKTDIDEKIDEGELPDSGLFVEKAKYFEANKSGSVNLDIGLNYDRSINTPLNPRKVRFNDINLTLKGSPKLNVNMVDSYEIFDNKELDNNVTFVYGRVKPSKLLYDDIREDDVETPVSVVIYCDLGYLECLNRIPSMLDAQTNESFWWKSVEHDTVKDGNIVWRLGSPIEGSGTPTISASSATISLSDGEDSTVKVGKGPNPVLPLEIPIELVVNDPANPPAPAAYTDRWLIYNKYDANSAPSPFFKVRFIGNAGWTGVGKTGNVVETDGGDRKTNRLDW